MRCAALRRMFLVALLLGTWSYPLLAGEFYVSTLGSDAGPGSAALPWQTLQKAANSVGPGDRVTVRAGQYTNFRLLSSGTAGNPIEFFAEPGVLINAMQTGRPDGINLELASYVVVDGFNVTGMPRAGVRTVGLDSAFAEDVIIRNVNAYNNGTWGIFTGFVNDLLIEDNHTSGSGTQHGIYVSNSADRPVVRRNVSFDNFGSGIHMNGDINTGDAIDGIISDALVSGNIIYNNGGGSGLNMDGVVNSRVENNLLYNNHASGISLFQQDGGAPSTGNVVVNNTIHMAADGRWALNIQDGSMGNTVYNNILVSNHPSRGAIDISPDSLSGFVSDFNVVKDKFTSDGFIGLTEWQSLTGQDTNSIIADPEDLFIDPAGGNYHLLPTAAARDLGTSLEAPAVDLAGQPRTLGAGVDRGAFEYIDPDGDFDFDGDLDGHDFLVWQRKPIVGNLADWQNNYSNASPPIAAVPEPSTILLLVIAALQTTRLARILEC